MPNHRLRSCSMPEESDDPSVSRGMWLRRISLVFFIAQVLNCTALQAEVLSTSTQSALPNEGEMHHAHSRQQAKMVYKNIRTKQYQKGYHHIVSFWADSAWDVDICWAFVTNKESYCRKHGILWSFRRMHFVPHRHFQESLALRIAIVSELGSRS